MAKPAAGDTWIDALLDGDHTSDDQAVKSPVIRKLFGLKRAFLDMHLAELDAPINASALFKWGELSVLERLHAGDQAELYRAFDPMLQREVALKLQRSQSGDSDSAQQFIRGARRLAQVRHPNVVAVQGAGLHDGRAGMWMDLIDGETLAQSVARSGPLDANSLLRLLMQLAAALCALHAKKLVHGELTAAKVMCEAPRTGRFLLLEFAGLHVPAAATEHLDIYALGQTLYFAASGRAYVSGDRALEARGDLAKDFCALIRALLDTTSNTLSLAGRRHGKKSLAGRRHGKKSLAGRRHGKKSLAGRRHGR